jgi:cell fate (sporulation/competence/biofilm development) regulator YlbF (YheA/YmcA/DUF963 family)
LIFFFKGDIIMDKGEGGSANKNSICAQAALLGDLLVQSSEYRQYREAKLKLQGDQERSYLLSLLRRQQVSLHLAQILGMSSYDAEDDLERLYTTFCLEPVVCDFLYAEGRLGRLISEVQQICGDKLELWSESEAANPRQDKELN